MDNNSSRRKWFCFFPVQRLLMLLALVTTIGCGGKPASVSGVVTLDGEPVPRGTVAFAPVGGGMQASGKIESDGSYVLQTNREAGLDVGEYKVTVSARQPGKENPSGGPPMPGPFITPRQYAVASTSGIQKQVEAGSNEINLELSSQKK